MEDILQLNFTILDSEYFSEKLTTFEPDPLEVNVFTDPYESIWLRFAGRVYLKNRLTYIFGL